MNVEDLVSAIENDLSPEQRKFVTQMLREEEPPKRKLAKARTVLPSEQTHEVLCVVTCTLCDATTSVIKRSSENIPITCKVSCCGACESRLIERGAPALAAMLLARVRIDPPKLYFQTWENLHGRDKDEEV
jgi:hypothetical protein